MSIAEKLQTIAENEQRVYEAGYQEGLNYFKKMFADRETNFRVPDGFEMLKGNLFSATWYLGKVTIPSSVYYLANNVFQSAYALVEVTFEGGKITTFGSNMFQSDSALKRVYFGCEIPNGLPTGTFSGCSKLEEVTFNTIAKNVYLQNTSVLKKSCAYDAMRKVPNYIGTSEQFTYAFKLHATVWANVEDTTAADYEAPPSGETWQDYVINHKGYNI